MSGCGLTNEDEGQSDAKGQDVATQGLVVLAVTFGKDAQARVDVVFAQSLRRCRWFSKTGGISILPWTCQVSCFFMDV